MNSQAQTSSAPPAGGSPREEARAKRSRTWQFVALVSAVGAVVLALALRDARLLTVTPGMIALAAITVVSGRFRVRVPGYSASVSVSEVFVFASVLLYGAAPATLTVAADGLFISLTHRDRRLYRAMFNIAEPAISTSFAAHVFFATLAWAPAGSTHSVGLILPSIAMAGAYFAANSTLTAVAVALESGTTIASVWRGHALYLAMNYYAAASIAALVFPQDGTINVGVIGLVAPLLLLSYGAYQATARRVEETGRHLKEVETLYEATIETLAVAVDAKDQVTHGHIRRVQRHTLAVARALGVVDPMQLRGLEAASLLHDVGKLAVPDYVLNKPGSLSTREFTIMKAHAAKGAEILTNARFPYAVVPVVRHHHEQWNGKGYPDGLAGDAIPFGARILSVVDCFDAVTSDRPYRRRMTDAEGIEILRARSGTMYDPKIVEAFVALVPALRAEDAVIDRVHPSTVPAPVTLDPESLRGVSAPAEVAAVLAEAMRRWPDAEACLFEATDQGRLHVAWASPSLTNLVGTIDMAVGDGLAGWVAANRHTIVNSHADLDLGKAAASLGLGACTATPVLALGELVGVLAVYWPAPRRFALQDVQIIGALAQDIGSIRGRALLNLPAATSTAA